MENNNFKPFPFEQLKQKKEPEKTAVAIAYEPGEKAPKILATGKGQVAEKIIEKAKESQVPTYKDNKLASTLSKLQIGDMIPPELYEVVAEILVFVDDMDRMKAKIDKVGTEYETMAARYLCTHDYTILARNYRTPFGEVDLIAQKDGVLVYVEVKYRSSNDYGDPLEAVDRRKQRQICKVANYHYAGYAAGQEMDCRFDVIGIYGDGSIRHIPNAFYFQR